MGIAIGEHCLRAKGAISIIEACKRRKDYTNMWIELRNLNSLLRDIKAYKFDTNNFIEQTVWIPLSNKLLNYSSTGTK